MSDPRTALASRMSDVDREVQLGAEETALLAGDLSRLSELQRASLVTGICRSLGLNPLTRPLQYIQLNGKLTLYASKDCTDQLRKLHRVSTQIVGREMLPGEIYCVTARATLPDGRMEERIGAVSVAGRRGDELANALMKAETKSVRRVTLGVCGLGFLDEMEVETIPGARTVVREEARPPVALPQLVAASGPTVDASTGEVIAQAPVDPQARYNTYVDLYEKIAAETGITPALEQPADLAAIEDALGNLRNLRRMWVASNKTPTDQRATPEQKQRIAELSVELATPMPTVALTREGAEALIVQWDDLAFTRTAPAAGAATDALDESPF